MIFYIYLFMFQLVGVSLHVGQKVSTLGNSYPEKSRSEILKIFWQEDWDTLFISAVVIVLDLLTHGAIDTWAPEIVLISNFHLYSLGVALIMGYAGQRLIYKYMGSAEEFLNRNVENKLK